VPRLRRSARRTRPCRAARYQDRSPEDRIQAQARPSGRGDSATLPLIGRHLSLPRPPFSTHAPKPPSLNSAAHCSSTHSTVSNCNMPSASRLLQRAKDRPAKEGAPIFLRNQHCIVSIIAAMGTVARGSDDASGTPSRGRRLHRLIGNPAGTACEPRPCIAAGRTKMGHCARKSYPLHGTQNPNNR